MDQFIKKTKHFADFCLGFLPSRLPIGMTEFDSFCTSTFETYSLPDFPSYRHAIATIIMHLGPTTMYKSKWFFVLSVRKSMANQVAFENIQLIKQLEQTGNALKTVATPKESKSEPVQNQAI